MPTDDFPPHNPDFPDVNPATGDERETTEGPAVEQTLAEQIEHDCDPETDEDTYNHRFDEAPNVEPPASD